MFFCLETKEPKIQDLDLFPKKSKFLLIKSLNLRGNERFDFVFSTVPRFGQKGFLGVVSWKSKLEEICFFLNVKIS